IRHPRVENAPRDAREWPPLTPKPPTPAPRRPCITEDTPPPGVLRRVWDATDTDGVMWSFMAGVFFGITVIGAFFTVIDA
ncbi:MAG: hypothetical protein ACRD0P_30360, partial [Stackebrandtia sp.]